MDNTNLSNEAKQSQTDLLNQATSTFVSSETVSHMRNLILNANFTITASTPQQKTNQEIQENSRDVEKPNEIPTREPIKKRIFSVDSSEAPASFNPLTSLPLSLISNGTLSVTSESSCVTIENGKPILKEINDAKKNHTSIEKPSNNSAANLIPGNPTSGNFTSANLTPCKLISANSTRAGNYAQPIIKSTVDENFMPIKNTSPKGTVMYSSSKDVNSNLKEPANDGAQLQERLNINKVILEALTDVTREGSFCKFGLIPNPNQMNFLTLLGLEIVVDHCCANNTPNDNQQTPLQCGQCHTDFTPHWHFFKSPLKVLCDHCFSYNEQQVVKAAQTVRLTKEYTKYFHLKQATDAITKHTHDDNKASTLTEVQVPGTSKQQFPISPPDQKTLFRNYMNAAGICMKENSVSDLSALGAAIASNYKILDAAKIVNSLDSTASPLSRAKAVQDFQIALFEGLQQKLSPSGSNDTQMPEQALLRYQMAVAQMKNAANIQSLLSNNPVADSPLTSLIRAMELQHQSLVKTILKQNPKMN